MEKYSGWLPAGPQLRLRPRGIGFSTGRFGRVAWTDERATDLPRAVQFCLGLLDPNLERRDERTLGEAAAAAAMRIWGPV